jgi:hypothetical protein
VTEGHYSKDPCRQCHQEREARARARQAANVYGWNSHPTGRRDSCVEPSLGQALVGMPGSEFSTFDPNRRRQPAPTRQQRQGPGSTWPTPPRAYVQAPVDSRVGAARPVRNLPPIPGAPAQARVPPSVGYPRTPEAMRAGPPRTRPIRAPKPAPIKVQRQAAYCHRPQIVHQRVAASPQAAVVQRVDVTKPVRRDSNGVSEFGSEDGDLSGWRGQLVSPRTVSPLSGGGPTYQSWPMP